MKRKAVIGAFVIAVVALAMAGAGYAAFRPQASQVEPGSAATAIGTSIARLGDISIFSSGTGEIVAAQETTLNFEEAGTLTEILVNLGDQVKTGDVLARLRVNQSAAELAAEIAQAELTVLENQQALEALYTNADLSAAQALLDLETAQKELDEVLNDDLEIAQAMQTVAAAQEAVDDAEMQLYILNSAPSDAAIYTAYASFLFKEKRYNELKDQVEHLEYELKTAPDKPTRSRISSQLDRARAQFYNQQIIYEAALYHYENIDAPADSVDLNVAQTQMASAQLQLEQANEALAEAQQGPPAGEAAQAQAALNQAQAEWERWQDGPDPQEVSLAETRLATSQMNLQILQQENLVIELVAPIDGTVISIPAVVNQRIQGDDIITLADTSQMLLEISLDETDFETAQVGNRIEATFDAFPDTTFPGAIVDVSPSLESTFGSQAIKALAVLDASAYAKPLALPLGLSASVDVIAGETTDAVLVPVEALHLNDSGNYGVYVQADDGNFAFREVTVGLTDYTSAAITSGLKAGEVVAIDEIGNELPGN